MITKWVHCGEARTPQFKIAPKIHKKRNPGGPIVSSVSCQSSNISQYNYHQLQLHIKKLKLYLKDSSDFVPKLNNIENVLDGFNLVTMDVGSLYTNILNTK